MGDTARLLAVAQAGGLLASMAFIHFFVDWIPQTHSEATSKHCNAVVRARHCLVYASGFVPLLIWLGISWQRMTICVNVLFWSHFVQDTYYFVYLWARYIRRPFIDAGPDSKGKQLFKDVVLGPESFSQWVSDSNLGLILTIAIDQIIHLAFLVVVVAIVMWP